MVKGYSKKFENSKKKKLGRDWLETSKELYTMRWGWKGSGDGVTELWRIEIFEMFRGGGGGIYLIYTKIFDLRLRALHSGDHFFGDH